MGFSLLFSMIAGLSQSFCTLEDGIIGSNHASHCQSPFFSSPSLPLYACVVNNPKAQSFTNPCQALADSEVEVVLPLCGFFTGAPRYLAAWGLTPGRSHPTENICSWILDGQEPPISPLED